MRPVIRVADLWKRYRIGAAETRSDTFYDVLSRALHAPLARLRGRAAPRVRHEDFWALRGVEFEVARGEVLGVIGRNGAGKSTLLKILSRITEPTRGRIEIVGRVSSLLEVGTGFHPELTGRENIFLNGAILGMGRREIARKFDEIVAFAEIEQFLDTPVKRYSSGMYVRLAFAVAAHMEPDVLLVDEVLAVGDFEFQQRCLAKMNDVGRLGRTVLFVSHNLSAIRRLCTRSLLIDRGMIAVIGSTSEALDMYTASGARSEVVFDGTTAPGNERCRIEAVSTKLNGMGRGEISTDDELTIQVEFSLLVQTNSKFAVVVYLHDPRGADVLSSMSTDAASSNRLAWFERPQSPGRYRASCSIPGSFLNDLTYSISAFLVSFDPMRVEASARHAVTVEVVDSGSMREAQVRAEWHGVVRPRLNWHVEGVAP